MKKTEAVELVKQRGSTSIFIDVKITDDGGVQFSGQDIGEAPSTLFGDSDYEYWLTIPAEEKDRFLLALLEKHYKGNPTVISEMRQWLEALGIPCTFDNYM